MFDVVIPVGPNDTEIISKQIVYTKKKKNILGVSEDISNLYEWVSSDWWLYNS